MLPILPRLAPVVSVLRVGASLSLALAGAVACRAAVPTAETELWKLAESPARVLVERVEKIHTAEVEQLRARLIAEARGDAGKAVLVRPTTLAGLSEWRVPLKYTVQPPHLNQLGAAEWERFCLSQGDSYAGNLLVVELPRIAAAAALTQDEALVDRVIAQLMELCRWSPLERRGWSLSNIYPTYTGDDGAWLGTGWLVRAIADSVELLPPEKIPAELRVALTQRMKEELALMQRDWETQRPWYIREQAVHSNQWILPNEAMVRACLLLGRGESDPTYELGIRNLLRSLDSEGSEGEFVEGLHYSSISTTSLYSIARATARAGDRRLISHSFLKKYPTWLAHHFQPGGFLINCFDAPTTARGTLQRDQPLLEAAALVSGNPHALWSLQTRARFGPSLDGLVAASLPSELGEAPPLFAQYQYATRLNWRSSWDDDRATGIWIRGGHPNDFHDHMDRGHVNFIIGNQALLIEAGMQSYATPVFQTHMRTVAGHNVLQVGQAPPEQLKPELLQQAGQILDADHRQAPITVERMDANGGSASVDLSKCYRDVEKWVRHVEWNSQRVIIKDHVELRAEDLLQFRWHLGVPLGAAQSAAAGRIAVGPVQVNYEANQPVTAVVEGMPDATLKRGVITEHACVVMRTAGPVRSLEVVTQVSLVEPPGK